MDSADEAGTVYSPSRFLTLWTAAEGYWRSTAKAGEKQWGIHALAERAGISEHLSTADTGARGLIGRLRRYHAHLSPAPNLTPDEIAFGTMDSTRRLQALLQACLLRELGLETERIEQLIEAHYLSWPIR